MRLYESWIVARKDLKVFMKKRNIMVSTFVVPILLGTVLPWILRYVKTKSSANPDLLFPPS